MKNLHNCTPQLYGTRHTAQHQQVSTLTLAKMARSKEQSNNTVAKNGTSQHIHCVYIISTTAALFIPIHMCEHLCL